MMKKKLKQLGVGMLAVLTLVMGMLSGTTNVFAADEDTKIVTKQVTKTLEAACTPCIPILNVPMNWLG